MNASWLYIKGGNMKKEEILQKAQQKKDIVGEMEKTKINKSCWIANIVAVILAVAFMILEGALARFTTIYILGFLCFTWACVFYFCQYFVAKRLYFGILLGAVLEALGAVTMLTMFILKCVGVM